MFLLGKVATDAQRARFLDKLLTGEARSAFFMTEPSARQWRRVRPVHDEDHLRAGW